MVCTLVGCEKKPEAVTAPQPTLTVEPGLRVYVPYDSVRVSVVSLAADGKVVTTFAGRVAAGAESYAAGTLVAGGIVRLRFDRGGTVGRGEDPSWFKSDGVTELAMSPGMGEHVYKGGTEEVTASFDGKLFTITPGAPPSAPGK